ncbi:MAG: DUF3592 domain-containing protein [Rhodobacteraceae bacterium]|nr:DUF3592 domain-containing protein [Paracoccaceae bacterium]
MTQPNGFFFRKTVGNTTVPTWRTKVLVWGMPIVFILAGIVLLASSFMWMNSAQEATGTVVRVTQYDDSFSGDTLYLPVFSYIWSDGTLAESSLAAPSPALKYEIGDMHTILFNSERKEEIRISDTLSQYLIGLIILAIGAMFSLVSLFLWFGAKTIARKRDLKKD